MKQTVKPWKNVYFLQFKLTLHYVRIRSEIDIYISKLDRKIRVDRHKGNERNKHKYRCIDKPPGKNPNGYLFSRNNFVIMKIPNSKNESSSVLM